MQINVSLGKHPDCVSHSQNAEDAEGSFIPESHYTRMIWLTLTAGV